MIEEEVYNKCRNDWGCASLVISSLPFEDNTKKRIMEDYIEKFVGKRIFLAQVITEMIYHCNEFNSKKDEINCYLSTYYFGRVEIPLKESSLLLLHSIVRNIIKDNHEEDLLEMCKQGNNLACNFVEEISLI
ncbi:hypothetical protein [Acidianus sp. HS-5]|uniref:hypothetical protein n=1 Tax=Acidianus sp. HS-5 TaxID=2886040 RepID=UPI001F413891|nr:hypothetical protein [Acidianus sp. HS-5]BDC18059.1 hypothetical protein HS5_09490 [Acidianus sp. HS-5]